MKRLAILNYLFIFDPSETGFSSASQFEAYWADFCAAYGIEANVVETAGSGMKAIYLTKLEVPISMQQTTMQPKKVNSLNGLSFPNRPNPVGRPKQAGSQLRSITPQPKVYANQRDYQQGKLLKRKGYLKR